MYLPSLFAETDPAELHRLIRAHPFGMLVTQTTQGLEADHLPFLFDESAGEAGRLIAHVARANPVWHTVRDGDAVLVVFRGAQAVTIDDVNDLLANDDVARYQEAVGG